MLLSRRIGSVSDGISCEDVNSLFCFPISKWVTCSPGRCINSHFCTPLATVRFWQGNLSWTQIVSGGGRVECSQYPKCELMERDPDPGPVIKLQQKVSHSGLILMLLLRAMKVCWVSIILRKVIVLKKRGRGEKIGRSEGRSERESDEWKQSPHWGCKNMAGNELIHIVSFCVSWPTWLDSFWSVRKRKRKRERERMKHKNDPQYIQFKNLVVLR